MVIDEYKTNCKKMDCWLKIMTLFWFENYGTYIFKYFVCFMFQIEV